MVGRRSSGHVNVFESLDRIDTPSCSHSLYSLRSERVFRVDVNDLRVSIVFSVQCLGVHAQLVRQLGLPRSEPPIVLGDALSFHVLSEHLVEAFVPRGDPFDLLPFLH